MHFADIEKVSPVEFLEQTDTNYREMADVALRLARCWQNIDYWRDLALKDVITGLPNRRAFYEDLDEYAEKVENDPRRRIGIGILDLDEFKASNDRYGHEYGDRILQFTAETVSATVSRYGGLYRLGGDEFGILFHRVSELKYNPEQIMWNYARDLETLMSAEYEASPLRREGLRVGASIAIVRSRQGESVESLMKRADAAMYERKRAISSRR